MKILQNEIPQRPKVVFPPILVVNWVSSDLSFFLSSSTAATYIFTAPTCTITIITLEPCALNAEFQNFIPRFNKNSLLSRYHWKRGFWVGGGKQAQKQGDFKDNFTMYEKNWNLKFFHWHTSKEKDSFKT